MENTYKLTKLKDGEYYFDTKKGVSYCIEINKSNVSYKSLTELTPSKINFINLFRFSLFDSKDAIESDNLVSNTIIQFLLKHLLTNNNDSILFFVNNECEDIHLTHRGKSRLKLFRRLLRKVNTIYNLDYIFLTNEHFILNHKEYTIDYIGIIIKLSSPDYINIVRAFNKFCHENSYQKN